ncbi:polyprenyl synthetase family protein [Desulfofundulus thermocisternus]|uniref:polyprenyl synthetase family protein n=1 Tax=Desulfofundulus thermocisternus TaxID=42471 RepID=UPI0019EB8272|nr:farnesyl diphosphate synthase [Desulfofundulus thermocisternus]MBE3584683.1 polyprenyl synthetase family protein [Thermoanaerobacter sp.]MCS5694778.1 polyprenyl synthetase family protein [Desulfofundulus thermocisternus]
MDFLAELKARAALVDRALDEFLPPEDAYPPVIHRAMRYSLFAGGKRLRPVLVLAAAETVGGDPVKVLPAACALELIHTYSLIHDDLPAMDNDDFRRGKPTCHRVYGEAVAILAGDALLTHAFALLAKNAQNQLAPAERVVQVIEEVAAAAGTLGLIGGQVVDTLAADTAVDAATLEYIHRHKTGALYRVAVRAGAILAGAKERQLEALTIYADNLGLAFQIQDDILDVEGDPARLGKPVGSDERNKKATYPALFGLDVARTKAGEAVAAALAALEPFDERADFLRELVRFVITRDF